MGKRIILTLLTLTGLGFQDIQTDRIWLFIWFGLVGWF